MRFRHLLAALLAALPLAFGLKFAARSDNAEVSLFDEYDTGEPSVDGTNARVSSVDGSNTETPPLDWLAAYIPPGNDQETATQTDYQKEQGNQGEDPGTLSGGDTVASLDPQLSPQQDNSIPQFSNTEYQLARAGQTYNCQSKPNLCRNNPGYSGYGDNRGCTEGKEINLCCTDTEINQQGEINNCYYWSKFMLALLQNPSFTRLPEWIHIDDFHGKPPWKPIIRLVVANLGGLCRRGGMSAKRCLLPDHGSDERQNCL